MSGCEACSGSRGAPRDNARVEGPGGLEFARCADCGLLSRTGRVLREARPRPDSSSIDEAVVAGRRPLYDDFLELLSERCPPGELLDVGCGSGAFLDRAAKAGWCARGADTHPEACRLAASKNLSVFCGELADARYPPESFDAVTLWEVLDIAEDPLGLLREVLKSAKPGGFVFVRVRNGPFHRWAWKMGRLFRLRLLAALPIVHRRGFTAEAMRRMLSKAGFLDVHILRPRLASLETYDRGSSVVQHAAIRGALVLWRFFSAALFRASREKMLLDPSLIAVCRKPHPRPRILHVITRMDTGGSSENVALTARHFSRKGYDTLVASGPSPEFTREASEGSLRWTLLSSLTREIRPWRDVSAFLEIGRLIRRWNPDILHTHSSKAGILGRAAARFWGAPAMRVVHTPHGHVFYGYFGRVKSGFFVMLERIAAWRTDFFVALSEGEKRESLELGIGSFPRWVVIPSGVRLDGHPAEVAESRRRLRGKWNIPDQATVIGTVARLEPVKGVPVLVEAAARVLAEPRNEMPRARSTSSLAAPGALSRRVLRFLIVGDGRQSGSLKARARELGIESHVVFVGYQESPSSSMAAMDIYAQPSLNEGMGKTLVMAQSLGLPVVASRVCGIPDVVLDRKSGLLVAPGDPEDLARALGELLRDAGLRRRLGQEGKRWIAGADATGFPRFSDQAMLRRLESLYAKLST